MGWQSLLYLSVSCELVTGLHAHWIDPLLRSGRDAMVVLGVRLPHRTEASAQKAAAVPFRVMFPFGYKRKLALSDLCLRSASGRLSILLLADTSTPQRVISRLACILECHSHAEHQNNDKTRVPRTKLQATRAHPVQSKAVIGTQI